jgi:hypothetical protein
MKNNVLRQHGVGEEKGEPMRLIDADEYEKRIKPYDTEDDMDKALYNFAHYHLVTTPSAQPFHNITMNDVLKYIDGMPEDVWQEFTACLECRGWELQRRTAKWCGSEFA